MYGWQINQWFGLNVYVACIIENQKNQNQNQKNNKQQQQHFPNSFGGGTGANQPLPRRRTRKAMSIISQRSPMKDSDIVHSAHNNNNHTTL